jgi:dienelactone hydrolase
LYLPKDTSKKHPAVLYVCGHGGVKENGVSYGNKVHYQHHGAWFARHGYVCLTIDSLQLGEIEATHHGTYRYGMWWWNNRGYSPAGVEAWNCVRSLDYLETRDEVDASRMGVTGRSGGGAYSWWIAAIDDRIQAAVPVAGITDLENHVVDGTVEGHCDCMFFVNTYRWDYPLLPALVAPRPLLISNSDRDGIFPLEGVVRTHFKTRKIYDLYDASEKLGLQITSGPHEDTQELRIHAFRWFDRFLQNNDRLIDKPAVPFFEPEQLRVFQELPEDQLNTTIHETFVKAADPPSPPESAETWRESRVSWLTALRERSFRAWPDDHEALNVKQAFAAQRDGLSLQAYDFTSQGPIQLRLYLVHRAGLTDPELAVLNVLDSDGWQQFLATMRGSFEEQLREESLPEADPAAHDAQRRMLDSFKWVMAYVAPRGIGPTAWDQSERKQIQHRRRFMLLGQTLDGMQVWDARRAIQTLRQVDALDGADLWLQGERQMGGVALYASLFEPDVARLDLHELPVTHREGPILLNVRRFLDMPQAVAMASERSRVVLYDDQPEEWAYPREVAKRLGWAADQFQVRQGADAKADSP